MAVLLGLGSATAATAARLLVPHTTFLAVAVAAVLVAVAVISTTTVHAAGRLCAVLAAAALVVLALTAAINRQGIPEKVVLITLGHKRRPQMEV